MKLSSPRFNMILALVLAATLGCKTTEEKKREKEAGFIRLHLETNPDGTHHNATVPVHRSDPMLLNVEKNAVLDEGFMEKVELVAADEFGNHAIKLTFNDAGKKRLDYVTTSYKGRRLGVHARWTEDRWLGAPLINKRITDGVFIFTPDASREESERLVAGLNNVINRLKKPYTVFRE